MTTFLGREAARWTAACPAHGVLAEWSARKDRDGIAYAVACPECPPEPPLKCAQLVGGVEAESRGGIALFPALRLAGYCSLDLFHDGRCAQ